MGNQIFVIKVFFAIALLLPFLGTSNAASIPGINGFQKRDGKSPIVLSFDVNRTKRSNNTVPSTSKAKAGPKSIPLTNQNEIAYNLDLSLGSNKQKVSVSIDTGSSDLWVVGPNAQCQDCDGGTYDPSSSSSSKDINLALDDSYGIGEVKGEWYTDNVYLGSNNDIALNTFQFGVGKDLTDLHRGILGVGFEELEEPANNGKQYTNFPSALVKQGYISKKAYSLYLNSRESSTGTIIFGGVDTAKYSGDLVTLPFTDDRYLSVNLPSISVKGTSLSFNQDALLDSGTTLLYIKRSLAAQFAKALGSKSTKKEGGQDYYVIDCSYQDSTETAEFQFNQGLKIEVPLKEFVWKLEDGTCTSAVLPQDPGQSGKNDQMAILGDVFLRSAYLVYNLDDRNVQMAQAKFTDSSNLVSL